MSRQEVSRGMSIYTGTELQSFEDVKVFVGRRLILMRVTKKPLEPYMLYNFFNLLEQCYTVLFFIYLFCLITPTPSFRYN